jgi:integrase
VTRPPPHILTPEEAKTCATWLQENPKMLGHWVLSTFAGLRPEEAAKTTWKEINFEEGWIRVEAQTTKVRQRRVVYPPKMVFDWLRAAKEAGTKLTNSRTIRNRVHRQLCKVLGWKHWKKDITRHSATSYWLSQTHTSRQIVNRKS